MPKLHALYHRLSSWHVHDGMTETYWTSTSSRVRFAIILQQIRFQTSGRYLHFGWVRPEQSRTAFSRYVRRRRPTSTLLQSVQTATGHPRRQVSSPGTSPSDWPQSPHRPHSAECPTPALLIHFVWALGSVHCRAASASLYLVCTISLY